MRSKVKQVASAVRQRYQAKI